MTCTKTFASYNVWSDTTEPMIFQVSGMLEVLKGLDDGQLPDSGRYTSADLQQYLRSLVKAQTPVRELPPMVNETSIQETGDSENDRFFPEEEPCADDPAGAFWSVSTALAGMPAQGRMAFVTRPTIIAVATLSRCLLEFPVLAASVPGIVDALQAGLLYSAGALPNDLHFAFRKEYRSILDIFNMGWVPLLLWQNPRLCPRMNLRLGRIPRLNRQVRSQLRRQHDLQEDLLQEDLVLRRRIRCVELHRFVLGLPGLTGENEDKLMAELKSELMKLEALPAETAEAGSQDLMAYPGQEGDLRDLVDLIERMERIAPTLREVVLGDLARTPCLPQRDPAAEEKFLRKNPGLRLGRSMKPEPRESEKAELLEEGNLLSLINGDEEDTHDQ